MESKKFFAVTVVLYFSSLISYYSQIKIIDFYGVDVKYYLDLYTSYLQITITLVILGLPNAISIMVIREKKIPRNIKGYSLLSAIISSTILNFFFLDGSLLIQLFIFIFLFISLFNDLNTSVMSSVGMFEYPRVWQLVGNVVLLFFVFVDPFRTLFLHKLSDAWYAIFFIIVPILPFFIILIFGKKYKETLAEYQSVSLASVFKYLNYIYFFSILSIIMTRIPYINFSTFMDKHSLAQYTLSVSLSNFMVIPLSIFTLKILSAKIEKNINIKLINFILILSVLLFSLLLHYISSNFNFLYEFTNISSANILTSTYLLISTVAISSINLSVSLRLQKKLRTFVILDLTVVALVIFITMGLVYPFKDISGYNYLMMSIVLLKVLFQIYFLREKNVHDHNCKL
ncbi:MULTISPECIES: hypothetical protein [unclassified Shewanella]|uniref:hypothetical protein n=1 Tax=unclassified Shewanella TaxID=196818 RepID=UPI0021D87F59|nr:MULTISPECIES: hypothetical protein [unclassified Shewanella]MCU8021993.1 hypothetical protein [Shewanella sp. SM78]MCU8079283.1 hypothetical protein [Shewanella sp. SM103]